MIQNLLFVHFFVWIFFSSNLLAQTYSNSELLSKNKYFYIGTEGGKWFLNTLHAPTHNLQEVLSTKYFTTKKEALDEANKSALSSLKKSSELQLFPVSIRTLVTTEDPLKTIWKTENTWTWEWEQKYSDWIHSEVNENFFKDHNIATDCADVAIAARWIFSRIHKLPAAQTLVGSEILFTNESFKKSWETLSTHEDWTQDALFLKALNYVLVNTYTHTLWKDSYPIHISKDTFLFGAHHLSLRDSSGHTMLYTDKNDQNIKMIYSDVPRKVRTLYSAPMNEDFPDPSAQGFLKIRWPKKVDTSWTLEASASMPFYSLNQYDRILTQNEAESYTYGFLNQMGLTPSLASFYVELIDNIYYSFQNRISIVESGFSFCQQEDCAPGTQNYENHSTPRRDLRILERILKAEDTVYKYGDAYPDIRYYWAFAQSWEIGIQNHSATIGNLIYIWKHQLYSSDPRDSIEKRWGLFQNP